VSTNISKQKREDLLAKIGELRTYVARSQYDENKGNLLTYLSELEKEIRSRKYGLVFEEHREGIDDVLATHTPVMTEDKDLFIDNDSQLHFLIEGDNLAALRLLLKTHRQRIDLIYIDPPYNTGSNDFMYDDNYVGEDDGYRHSKWMSFMQKRFSIAQQLLSPEGVVFIQISDIELAQLKNLCDAIFGEDNFLNIISVNMKNIAGASGGGEDKRFKKNCEYILVYAKNYSMLPIFNGAYEYTEMSELIQWYIDNGASWKYTSVLIDEGEKIFAGTTADGDGNDIRVYKCVNPKILSIRQAANADGITEKEAYKKYGTRIFQTTNAQTSIRTRVMGYRREAGITEDLLSIEYVPKTGRNKGKVYEQFYKGDKCRLFVWLSDTSEVIDNVLYKKDLQGTYWDYTSQMKNINKEAGMDFSNGKKPLALMQRIISLYPRTDTVVLDYFAGSGSTGHGVLAQNQDDNGNRQFILCTNNQNNICREKTYTRLQNVICGYTNDKGKTFPALS
jgi:adenine-specific DNA-methyltransferase